MKYNREERLNTGKELFLLFVLLWGWFGGMDRKEEENERQFSPIVSNGLSIDTTE